MSRLSLKTTMVLGGLVIMATTAANAVLSRQFVFGERHLERPIIEFLLWTLLSFVVYAFVVLSFPHVLGGNQKGFERFDPRLKHSGMTFSNGTFYWIILVSILCRLFYFPSALIQETDPYRYVWDGQTLLKGANPYQHSPEEAVRLKAVPADGLSTEAQETFERINHPGVRTIYPPLAQVFFALSQILSPWSFMGLKILIFLSEMIILVVLAILLKEIGKHIEWLVLYGWSPLVLKEYSNSLHLDVFAVLFLCVMFYCLLKQRLTLAFVFLALSVLVKWFAIVLLPLLIVWSLGKRAGTRQTLKDLFLFAGIFLLFYLPFLGAGRFLFEGLTRFSLEWQVNEGLFGIIRSRALAGFILAVVVGVVSFWMARKQDVVSFGKASAVALASLFFLSPAANPWYFTWVIPFLLFLPLRSLVLFSGLVFLYYFDFYFMYRSAPENFFWIRLIEYGLFFISLGWELWPHHLFRPQSGLIALQSDETGGGVDKKPTVALILPIANERGIIRDTLKHLCSLGADEVIVVDGSSSDGTFQIVQNDFPAARCYQTAMKDRALQMNVGAYESNADIYLFVHADMRLPQGAVQIIRSRINKGYIGGGFRKCYATNNLILMVYCALANMFYFYLSKALVGTNAIFVRHDVFERIGGFEQGSFMEDVLFSEHLRKYGKISLIGRKVEVSPRRYEERGILRQIWRNAQILFRYRLLRQDRVFLKELYG